ncbi:MAG: 6,7-dimethyl-8-ribityllumazine synthase [Aquiluna sp.]|jgi:6,7-dimethyl-8-ribityllumazine synthase
MSGSGAPQLEVSGEGLKVFVIASSWHTTIMDGLIAGARKELVRSGATDVTVWRVPGAFELPLAAELAIEKGAQVVIALGVVIRGETPHFDYVCDAATQGLTQVQINRKVPIGFGLLTVNTEQEALNRAGLSNSREDKGAEAVQAALTMARLS